MRKGLPFLIVIISLLYLASPTHAQNSISLTALEVGLWPEYDHPDMLVLYTFELSPDVQLPAEVTFRIPVDAGEAFGYGYYPNEGGMPVQEGYHQQQNGDWLDVTFTMQTMRGTLEYYDPALQKDGSLRQYTYHWPGDYAVESLTFVVQHPVGSENIQTSAASSTPFVGQNGLTYQMSDAGALATSQSYSFQVSYQKDSSQLSVENVPLQAASPLPDENNMEWLPWVLAIAGIILLAGGLLWFFLVSRQPQSKPTNRRRRRPAASEPEGPANNEVKYCHQCGRRTSNGDRFCRSCGAPLRNG